MRNIKIKGTNQIAQFPESMSDDEMRAMLQREFSQPRSMQQNVSDALKPREMELKPRETSFGEDMQRKVAEFLMSQGLISNNQAAYDVAGNLSTILSAAPVLGEAEDISDFAQAAGRGDTTGMVLAGAGAIPVVGGAIKKAGSTLNDKLQQKIDSDWLAAYKEYSNLPETNGGRLINTDEARELSDDYRMDRTKAGEVHAASSAFTKQIYNKLLSEPVAAGRENTVRFMGGGAGAGKSTALKTGKAFNYDPDITYDTTLSKATDAKKIDQALKSGRNAEIIHVYRDPVEAFENGVLTRGKNKDKPNGRIVPMAEVAKNHIGARKSIQELAEKYDGDERVKIAIYDNSRGRDNGDFVQSASDLPELNKSKEQLEKEMKAVLDRKLDEGFIDQKTYDQYLAR